MFSTTPIHLPGLEKPESGVYAYLTIAATADGDTTVGYQIRRLEGSTPLAMGCAPPCTREDLEEVLPEALSALLDAVASLLDWPPFD